MIQDLRYGFRMPSADALFGIQDGYIFNAVLQAGRTVRNYGFLVNNIGSIGTKTTPVTEPDSYRAVVLAIIDSRRRARR